ncbi:spore germination protein [Sporolactobacillus inulinus]|uniref:Spore germination protein n=1 Tax=Sporolactobacillus inulinus TaxID=2078 RepID=A0A4Y1ZHX0_9BACL|nr:spore germination protein [Sporolactobacillus inulinus]GAY78600.1 spore germination protein [Sporolactobacillus inulinus]
MNDKIKPAHQVGPVSAFFIPQVMQIGIGYLSFQQIITKYSQQDAWLASLISGALSLGILWVVLRLLENERQFGMPDLFSIHTRIFGRRIGTILNLFTVTHVLLFAIMSLRSYIEIVHVWVFPQMATFLFSLIFCLIAWYIVSGGMRTIAGVCLLSFIYLVPLSILTLFIVPHAQFENLLPFVDHSPAALLKSCYELTRVYLGFELLLYVYPFISNPREARKWAFRSALTTVYFYTTTLILAIAYFSQGELQNTIWPTVAYWKSVRFPLVEHIDIIAIVLLLWATIPKVCLCSWIIARAVKFTVPKIKMKYSLIVILALFIAGTTMIRTGLLVRQLNIAYTRYGALIIYIYLPILLFCQWIKKKRGRSAAS